MGDIFKEFLDKAPDIIDKAAQSPLGLAALSVLVLGIVGAFLFRNAAGKLKLAAFAMITGGFFGFMALVLIPSFLWSQPPEPPAKKMAIIAIFPLDSFGPNCRDGFLTAMHAETNIMPVMIDDVTIAEMKAGKTQLIDQHLRNAFANNVLGVIGPPISEIAFQIASSVADLNSKVPVLLTAAISANDPIWPILRQRLPMFRVGSGVGQRAAEVQTFLTHLLSQGKKIVFLVEHHATPDALSFGVMFFHDVEKQMNDFSNISTNDYQRIYFASSRIEEQVESFQRIFSKKDTVVFLMGLDFQMRFLVERFYKKNSNNAEPRAILVGWMNAHALNSLYSHGEYYSDLVFDISDFGPMASLDFPNGAGRVMCQSETRWFTMILRWLSCAE